MRHLLCLLFFSLSLFAEPPKAIVFDFGGVVANVERKPMIEFLSDSLHVPYKKIKEEFRSDKLYEALAKPRSFWEGYAKKTLDQQWEKKLEEHKKMILQEIEGMTELVTLLKEKGIQVALLSNTSKHRARFIARMGGYDLFDPILLSCFLGVHKPSPEAYQKLTHHLRFSLKECLFIDNKKANVKAGKKAGIDSIQFKSIEQLKEELAKREISL